MPTTVATVTSNTSSLLSISSSIGSSELSPHRTSPSPQPLQRQHQNHHCQTNASPLKTRSDLLPPHIGHVEHSQANRFSLGGNVSGTLSNNSRLPTDNQENSRETHHQEEILTKNELSLMMKNRLRMGSTKQDYKFYQIIGRGSYGTVWKARSNHTKQVIAIKILDKNMIKNNGMMHHVRSELIIHLKMKHENIVELYHFFEDYTSIYMVMEYCKYNMLYHLQSKKKFSERRSRRYMRDIVAGLAHLHSHQIMHRDLKLANLLLTSDKVVKISDFGLSRYTKPNGECGTQLGTPKYMAYEVVLQKPYSQKADNWSLGCILYAFLEGRTPFHRDSETVEETFKLIQNMDFRIPDHFSFEAKDLISKLLERDPDKRISLSAVKRHNFFRSTSQEETIEEPVLRCFAMLTNLPEFNSSSLKAISHRSNDGNIQFELDREGLVHIILEGSSFVVSADSKDVWYTEKCTLGASKHYHRKELPKNLEHLYNYAYHFVEKVKSKTPSHIYNSSRGRCMLMQNEPKPDAEMIFYADGLRLVYNREDHRILIHEANKPVKIVKLEKDLLEIVDSDVYKTPNCTRREQNCIADLKFGIEQCIFMIETKNQNRLSGVSDSIFSVTTNSTHSTDLSTPLDTTITSSVLDISANTSTDE